MTPPETIKFHWGIRGVYRVQYISPLCYP